MQNSIKYFKRTAALISIAVTLPFYETVLYYALVTGESSSRPLIFYIQFASATIGGCLFIFFSIIVDRESLRKLLLPLISKIQVIKKKIRASLSLLLFLVPILFLVVLFFQEIPDPIKNLKIGKYTEAIVLASLWLLITLLSIAITKILSVLGKDRADLCGVISSWSLAILISLPFYFLLTFFAWYIIKPGYLASELKFSFYFGFTKDFLLLWIVAELLFISIFKLAMYGKVVEIFRSVSGYVQFLIVCAIIAILAIWAEFNFIDGTKIKIIYPNQWQRDIATAHVFIRDIFLLIFPIALLLVWVLHRSAKELSKGSEKGKKLKGKTIKRVNAK